MLESIIEGYKHNEIRDPRYVLPPARLGTATGLLVGSGIYAFFHPLELLQEFYPCLRSGVDREKRKDD